MAPLWSSSSGAPTTKSLKPSPFRSGTGARAEPKRAFWPPLRISREPSRTKRFCGTRSRSGQKPPKGYFRSNKEESFLWMFWQVFLRQWEEMLWMSNRRNLGTKHWRLLKLSCCCFLLTPFGSSWFCLKRHSLRRTWRTTFDCGKNNSVALVSAGCASQIYCGCVAPKSGFGRVIISFFTAVVNTLCCRAAENIHL